MISKQFRWWSVLVILSAVMMGCGRTVKPPPATAVAPTPSAIPSDPFVSVSGENLSPTELRATIAARPQDHFTNISVQEDIAFLSHGKRLIILDISTPSQPILMSELLLQERIKRVQSAGHQVYVVLETNIANETEIELQIVDVSDPLNPSKQGYYKPGAPATDAIVIGDAAHVIGWNNYWAVVDISNPNDPTMIGMMHKGYTDICYGCSFFRDIKGIKGYLHLFNGNNRSSHTYVNVYDVSDPLNPEIVESFGYPNGGPILDIVYAVGKDAYTFAPYPGVFFRILDLASESSYYNVAGELVLELPDTSIESGGLAAMDHYVYLASSDGLYIIDVLDRFRPSLTSTLYPNAYFSGIVQANGFVYLLDWDNGLIILDVSDPTNPMEIGKWTQ